MLNTTSCVVLMISKHARATQRKWTNPSGDIYQGRYGKASWDGCEKACKVSPHTFDPSILSGKHEFLLVTCQRLHSFDGVNVVNMYACNFTDIARHSHDFVQCPQLNMCTVRCWFFKNYTSIHSKKRSPGIGDHVHTEIRFGNNPTIKCMRYT